MLVWILCLALLSPLPPGSAAPPPDPPGAPPTIQKLLALQGEVRWSRGVRLHSRAGTLDGWDVEVDPQGLQVMQKTRGKPRALEIVRWEDVDSLEVRSPGKPWFRGTGEIAGYVGLLAAAVAALATPEDRDSGDPAGTAYVAVMALAVTAPSLGELATLRTRPWRTVYRRPPAAEQP